MNSLRQVIVVFLLGLRGLPERKWTGVVIVLGVATVVGVLLSMLSVTAGLGRSYVGNANPSRAYVYLRDNDCSCASGITPNEVGLIADAPGVARRDDGAPLVDAEFLMGLPAMEGFAPSSLAMNAISPMGTSLHPAMTIVSGRMFRSGSQEVILGAPAARRFGIRVGDSVSLPDGNWPVVGLFTDGGSVLESGAVADADTLLASTRRGGFGQVIVDLVSPAAFPAFREWLTSNPALAVEAEPQREYELRALDRNTRVFTSITYLIGVIMAIGAAFGAVRVLYAAVRVRAREIGILRAIGFRAACVSTSILLEILLLSVVGALLGAALAWAIFDGREMYAWTFFKLQIPARLVGLGIAWAIAIAVLSGFFPALRAGRVPAAEALRAR